MTEKNILNTEEAAAYLDITPDELIMSFMRGLPPGNQAEKKDGRLTWDRRNLIPPPIPLSDRQPAPSAPFVCSCGKEYKTAGYYEAHRNAKGH